MSPTGIWLNKHMEILLGKKKDAFALPFFFFLSARLGTQGMAWFTELE